MMGRVFYGRNSAVRTYVPRSNGGTAGALKGKHVIPGLNLRSRFRFRLPSWSLRSRRPILELFSFILHSVCRVVNIPSIYEGIFYKGDFFFQVKYVIQSKTSCLQELSTYYKTLQRFLIFFSDYYMGFFYHDYAGFFMFQGAIPTVSKGLFGSF